MESKWYDWTEPYYECQYCGCNNWTDLHHIQYRSQWGSDDATNLIMLCRHDHELVHKNNTPEQRDILKALIDMDLEMNWWK